jgi:hypothetical protein
MLEVKSLVGRFSLGGNFPYNLRHFTCTARPQISINYKYCPRILNILLELAFDLF